jgi:hypothetical protein
MSFLSRLAFVPGAAAALAPKCPLCVAAYASALGVGAAADWVSRSGALLTALVAAAVTFTLGALLVRARRAGSYAPLFIAGAAAILTMGIRAGAALPGMAFVAVGLFAAAGILSARAAARARERSRRLLVPRCCRRA